MPITKPFSRTYRPFLEGHRAEHQTDYIKDDRFAEEPRHYIQAFTIIEKDMLELFDYVEPAVAAVGAQASAERARNVRLAPFLGGRPRGRSRSRKAHSSSNTRGRAVSPMPDSRHMYQINSRWTIDGSSRELLTALKGYMT
jgi:hypothetical protein